MLNGVANVARRDCFLGFFLGKKMARIRTIKPEFWTDSLMVQLPHLTRLLYIALWNVADDRGYIRDEPERIAMEVMPRESGIDVDAALQLLFASGRLEWYVTDEGFSYYRVAHWENHQRVDHPANSKISREGSRKVAIPNAVRRDVAKKYGCEPGKTVPADCYYCGHAGKVHWFTLADGRPSNWVVFPDLELDHLECEHQGGDTSNENIVLSCRHCNRGKGTKHWFDFMMSKSLAIPREESRKLALDQGSRKGSRIKEGNGSSMSASPPIEFEELKASYPKRSGDLGWPKAIKACNARLAEGYSWDEMLAGTRRYHAYCKATGKIGTEYVKQAGTFFGPDKHFLSEWGAPPNKAEILRDQNIDASRLWLEQQEQQT